MKHLVQLLVLVSLACFLPGCGEKKPDEDNNKVLVPLDLKKKKDLIKLDAPPPPPPPPPPKPK